MGGNKQYTYAQHRSPPEVQLYGLDVACHHTTETLIFMLPLGSQSTL